MVTAGALDELVAGVERELLAFHAADPKATGIAAGALRDRVDRRLSNRVFDAALERAADAGLAVVDRGQVRHPAAAVTALADLEGALASLGPLLHGQGLAPSTVAELAAEAGVDPGVARKALSQLASQGAVVRLGPELHFDAAAIMGARERLTLYITQHGPATVGQLRDALGVSRKYVIPLLEYFDAQGVTKRDGDARILRET
jgi:selenocysteine-specific elongation factor